MKRLEAVCSGDHCLVKLVLVKLLARCCVWTRAAPAVPVVPSETARHSPMSRGMKISLFFWLSPICKASSSRSICPTLVARCGSYYQRFPTEISDPAWWGSPCAENRVSMDGASLPCLPGCSLSLSCSVLIRVGLGQLATEECGTAHPVRLLAQGWNASSCSCKRMSHIFSIP